ncbi:unnamed protein product [Arabis nemorensis]|uniref:Uncharacterized protein n=1 Tax=Arabis nemorensis TaxID=586526 RepID=A0A565C926_9BRAS|nr:unnamed protein product [Arabis nemorensis]
MSTEENPGKIPQDHELIEKVGDGVRPVSEEETIEQVLASDNEQIEDAENDSDKLKVLTSGIPTSLVNPLSGSAAQILPLLQNMLLHNEIQRERLMGLIQLYDPTAENRNLIVNTEGGQIAATETDLLTVVQFLEQSVQKLEEELENEKKANAQLEDEIKRLKMSSDPEQDD